VVDAAASGDLARQPREVEHPIDPDQNVVVRNQVAKRPQSAGFFKQPMELVLSLASRCGRARQMKRRKRDQTAKVLSRSGSSVTCGPRSNAPGLARAFALVRQLLRQQRTFSSALHKPQLTTCHSRGSPRPGRVHGAGGNAYLVVESPLNEP